MGIKILDISQIKEALKDKRLSIVAGATGLSYPTLKKLAKGQDNSYHTTTMLVISKYIQETYTRKGENL